MRAQGLFISSFLVSAALAAPAIVWKRSPRSLDRVLHSADDLKAADLLQDALDVQPETSSLAAVVFVVGRGQDGSESLTELASGGHLPLTASKYDEADAMYHHVSGVESSATMVRDATRANAAHKVLQVDLGEFNRKLTSLGEPAPTVEMEISDNGLVSKAVKHAHKRGRQLHESNVLIVTVDPTDAASEIDNAIAKAIENEAVENVLLTGIRSLHEVKHERYLLSKSRMSIMEHDGKRALHSSRRRLEQEEQEADENDNADGDNDNSDMSGIYYVSMTPNILAGLLFGLLFTVVTWIGVSCMGAIAGQDVYVSKMPSIGREA